MEEEDKKDIIIIKKNIKEIQLKIRKTILKVYDKKFREDNDDLNLKLNNILSNLKKMNIELEEIGKNKRKNVIIPKLDEIKLKFNEANLDLNKIEKEKIQEKIRKEKEEERNQENRNEILKIEFEERSRRVIQEMKRRKEQEERKKEEEIRKENERKKKIEERIKKLEEDIRNKRTGRRGLLPNIHRNNNQENRENLSNNNISLINNNNNISNNNLMNQINNNDINSNRINNLRSHNRINSNLNNFRDNNGININNNNRIQIRNNIGINNRNRINIRNNIINNRNNRFNSVGNDNRNINILNNRNNNIRNNNRNRINSDISNQDIKNIFEQLQEYKISDISRLNQEERRCIICLDNFEQNDILIYLPCFHFFHKDCIFNWIKRNAICPFCHLDIKENLNINIKKNFLCFWRHWLLI